VASLFVIRGNDQGQRFELEDPTLRLGRESSATIQLHDTEVSRQHAEIRRVDRDFSIADLDSSNGTFVNGKRIRQHRLSSGDQVQVGGTLMLYTGPSDEPDEDLARVISIAPAERADEESHIVHAVTQEEGSRIFDLATELPQNSWLARARGNLQVMYRTALAVSHTLDIDRLLQRIMELIFEWVEADRGCIMLIDPASKALEPKVRRTRDGRRADEKITISQTILDYVIERNEGVLTSDAREDDRFSPAASIVRMGVREAICVPVQGRYGVVGVIYIDTSTSPQEMIQTGGANKFTEDHLKLMIAIGHQAALAVEDTRYYSAMVQAERLAAVGQTVTTLSHHVKNILQGIRGGSYLIELGLTEHDETVVSKGWKIVEKNQNKISNLVMDMLTFSKQREPDLTTANLNRVVGDAVELMHSRADELAVELRWQPGEPMPDGGRGKGEGGRGKRAGRVHQSSIINHQSSWWSGGGPLEVLRREVHAVDRGGGQRPGNPARGDGATLQPLRLHEEGPGHGSGPARQPEDPQRARRPDPGRQRRGARQPVHAGAAGRVAPYRLADHGLLSPQAGCVVTPKVGCKGERQGHGGGAAV